MCLYGGLCLCLCISLSACFGKGDAGGPPTEVLGLIDWHETLIVEGEIKTANKTPLIVPGSGWERRNLVDMVPEGSLVRKGQVIARFDSPKARVDLSQAEIELLRKALDEQSILAKDETSRGVLVADRAKVEGDLQISERYAKAELTLFSRNQLLDALQDVGFLKDKRSYLAWKTGQVQARSSAEQAVLASQKESVSITANQQRKNLAELDLIAPHDGVFLLTPNWTGTKPQIGSSQRPGNEFGSLPDLNQLTAKFSIAESRTFGLKIGLPIKVRLAGSGQELSLKITKVGSNASVTSSDSPVKYSEFEAAIDAANAEKFGLKPGQAIQGTVSVISQEKVLTAPNIALVQDGNEFSVFVKQGSGIQQQKVQLGLRGPVRSEIKSGLTVGTHLVLIPEKKTDKKAEKQAEEKAKKS